MELKYDKKLVCIIPVHNALDCVKSLFLGLEGTEARDLETIIVDDASDEETRQFLVSYLLDHKNFSYVRNDHQCLFTRTCNRGLRIAQPDNEFYLLINTDCEVKPGFLNAMLDTMLGNPGTGIVGYPDGSPEPSKDQEAFYPSRHTSPDYITGHMLMLSKQVLREVGLLPSKDDGNAHINSERLFCWDAAANYGYRMFYSGSGLVVHDWGRTHPGESSGCSWKRDIGWLFRVFDYSTLWNEEDYVG